MSAAWGIARKATIFCTLLVCILAGPVWAGSHQSEQSTETEVKLTIDAPSDPLKEGAMLIQADDVRYNSETRIMEATGNVEVSNIERTLKADRLIYYEAEERIVAVGSVSITEANGVTYYAEEADLKDQMREGVLQSLEAVLEQNARLAGNVAYRRNGSVNEITKGVYTACNVCNEAGDKITPKWRFKAFRVVQDQEKLTVTYRDVFFEVFGIPVFYTPYFSHADPSVKRKSGFLWPSWGSSDLLGTYIKTPYYFALSPYYDLTVTPTIMSEGEVLLETNWRQNFSKGGYELDFGFVNARDRDNNNIETGDRKFLTHLFGTGRYQLNQKWTAKFDAELANDDTYLRRYNLRNRFTEYYNPLRLESSAYLTRIDGRNVASVSSHYFQNLQQNADPGKIPVVLPLANSRFVWEPGKWGRVNFDVNALVLQRGEGSDTRRLIISSDWERRITTRFGHVITPFASLRGDVYSLNDVPVSGTGTETRSETITRGLPTVGVEVSWPFVRPGNNKNFIIEPVVQAVASSKGGNDIDIPNEDSISFEFDTTNLFTPDRFPGYDRWEDGQRVNVGVKSGIYWNSGSHINMTFGRSYRVQDESPYSRASGLNRNESDYVGAFEVNFKQRLSINHRFRIDAEDGELNRNDITAQANFGPFSGSTSYISAKKSPGVAGGADREEITLNARLRLTDNWSVAANSRRDLETGRDLSNGFGFFYEDECTILSVQFNKRSYVDRDITPDDSITFNFILKSLN